jgi:hypothetical protein
VRDLIAELKAVLEGADTVDNITSKAKAVYYGIKATKAVDGIKTYPGGLSLPKKPVEQLKQAASSLVRGNTATAKKQAYGAAKSWVTGAKPALKAVGYWGGGNKGGELAKAIVGAD